MSDTPRTDERQYDTWSEGNQGMGDDYAEHVVSADFARQLERELAAMTAAKDKALEALKSVVENEVIGELTYSFAPTGLNALIAELEEVSNG